jgi:hypothetical protein
MPGWAWELLKGRRTRSSRGSPQAPERDAGAWQRLQPRFIDDPQGAMRHYRALFGEYDEEGADAPLSRDPAAADADTPARL